MHSDHLSSLKACMCLMFFDFCLWQRFMIPLAYLLKQPLSLPCLTFGFSWVCVSYLVDSISEVLFVWLLPFFSPENKGTAISKKGFPRGSVGKESASHCGRCRRRECDRWVRKTPWGRAWQPTPVFLPGRPHGQRSLGGYSPRGHRDIQLSVYVCMNTYTHTQLFRKGKDADSE